MHLPSRRSLILGARRARDGAPAAAAAARRPLQARPDRGPRRSAAVLRRTRRRPAAASSKCLTAPVSGTVSVGTKASPRAAEWDLAVVDRRSGSVLNGSAAGGCREYTSTVRPQGPAARRPGVPAGRRLSMLTVRYHSVRTAPRPSDRLRAQARARVRQDGRGARTPRGARARPTDHPATGPPGRACCTRAADEQKLNDAGFAYTCDRRRVARDRAEPAHRAAGGQRSTRRAPSRRADLPSGRTTYRTLADIEAELQARWPSRTRRSCASSRCR